MKADVNLQHYHKVDHNNANNSNIRLLTCAFLAALTTGGPVYAFGLYGGELKSTLHLTQSQLDTISSANFCAGLLSWIPGLMIDRIGVRRSLMLGGSLGATFMMLYWAVARQIIHVHKNAILPLLCFLGVFIFMTNGLVIGSIFKLIVVTCAPHTKGMVVGAAKGYVGLGSGVYSSLFRALKTPAVSDLDFLPLAAILAVLAAALPAMILLPSSSEQLKRMIETTPILELDQTTAVHLRCLYFGLVLLASMVIGTTLASLWKDDYHRHHHEAHYVANTEPVPPEESRILKAMLVLLAWLGPILALLVVPPKSKLLHEIDNSNHNEDDAAKVDTEQQQTIQDIVDEIDAEKEHDEEEDECTPLMKSLSSPALAYGAEITASVQVSGPRGMLGQKAIMASTGTGSNSSNSSAGESNTKPHHHHHHHHHPHREMPQFNLQEMLQTPMAWVFGWIAVIRVGGGTMVTNNMGQMVESLHLPKHSTVPAALALFSVAQAASRVATGALSDWALSWKALAGSEFTHNNLRLKLKGVPRPAFLILASLAGTLAHVFMSLTTTRNWFLMGVCFSGAAFGMIWPLMVLIVGEVFGTKHMGASYMFYDGLSSALGTLLLSKYVTQEVYEGHTDELESRTCYGQECFFASHITVAVLSFTCVLASYWFYRATRHVYAVRVD